MKQITSLNILAMILAGLVATSSAIAFERPNKDEQQEDTTERAQFNGLIVKYRSDTGAENGVHAKLAGGPATGVEYIQAQRLSAVQSVASATDVKFKTERQLATGGWMYRSAKNLTRKQLQKLAIKLMATDPNVEYAEIDEIDHPTYVPTDPLYSTDQWDMQDSKSQPGGLNLPNAWDMTKGDNVVVAIIDSGYRPHPDLLPNLVPAVGGAVNQYGYNFISDPVRARLTLTNGTTSARGPDGLDMGDWSDGKSCAAEDSSWHGTHVAGTVGATSNSIGITGVAPKAKILPLRSLGQCGGATSDSAEAIMWASGLPVAGLPANPNPAKVVNLSLGGAGHCTRTYADAIKKALLNGTVIVAAAGNDDHDAKLHRPSNCPGVISVGATSMAGSRAGYSNHGGMVTVVAPGGGQSNAADYIKSTLPVGKTVSTNDTSYGPMSGTSQATPHVAGTVALMFSVNPNLTPFQVKKILINTARPAPANCAGCGAGIVDAAAAVTAAQKEK